MREAINLIENFKVEKETNKIHYEVGIEIKNTIKKFEGTMHENLTPPDKNKKELEKKTRN